MISYEVEEVRAMISKRFYEEFFDGKDIYDADEEDINDLLNHWETSEDPSNWRVFSRTSFSTMDDVNEFIYRDASPVIGTTIDDDDGLLHVWAYRVNTYVDDDLDESTDWQCKRLEREV